jgi:hypothetical protein
MSLDKELEQLLARYSDETQQETMDAYLARYLTHCLIAWRKSTVGVDTSPGKTYTLAPTPGTNTGHGHVWARPDGMVARCGGPAICQECRSHATLMFFMDPLDTLGEEPCS